MLRGGLRRELIGNDWRTIWDSCMDWVEKYTAIGAKEWLGYHEPSYDSSVSPYAITFVEMKNSLFKCPEQLWVSRTAISNANTFSNQ